MAAPQIPWLAAGRPPVEPPLLTPCPAGWHTVTTGTDPATCEPWPETGRAACPAGQAHFPGAPACAVVGDACPAGDFPERLPPGAAVLYVRPGATGGDGSLALPFGTIRLAIGAASPGTVIALAKGTYDEIVNLAKDVTLWGACAAETVIRSSLSTITYGVVRVGPVHAELRNVTVADASATAIWLDVPGSVLTTRGVIVTEATSVAIRVMGGALLDAHDLLVARTRPAASGLFGWALGVESGAHASVVRAVLDANAESAVGAWNAGSLAHLEDTAIQDTASRPVGTSGVGVAVYEGAAVELVRCVVEGNHMEALGASGAGSTISVQDSVVRDTRPETSDDLFGLGIDASEGASITVSRCLLERNRQTALTAHGLGSSLQASDVVVRDTQPQLALGTNGTGAEAVDGGVIELARTTMRESHAGGIASIGAGSVATVTDAVVTDTRPEPAAGVGGYGLFVSQTATLTATRAVVDANQNVGVLAASGATLGLDDVVVMGTAPRASDGALGQGVHVQAGATATLRRVLVTQCREAGVVTTGAGTTTTLGDVVIRDTIGRTCPDMSCSAARAGTGLGTFHEGRTTVTRFVVETSPLCGVMLAFSGELDLHHGVVSHAMIGACVQVDGYDTSRLADDVRYTDVGASLQATMLPVPDIDL